MENRDAYIEGPRNHQRIFARRTGYRFDLDHTDGVIRELFSIERVPKSEPAREPEKKTQE